MSTVENTARPVALVTGATSGIGRGVAARLARDGFSVIVHGRDEVRGADIVESIRVDGGAARLIVADLTSGAEIERLAADAGAVDVLVNNAGFAWFGPTPELELERFDTLFAANVRAPYFLSALLVGQMVARGSGSIINVSSMAASVGLSGGAAYSATKTALSAFTRAWAAESSPAGIRVNAVAPGPVDTGGASSERIGALGATTILKRAAKTDEIAAVVAFLASDQASYLTGSVVAVDGGRTAI